MPAPWPWCACPALVALETELVASGVGGYHRAAAVDLPRSSTTDAPRSRSLSSLAAWVGSVVATSTCAGLLTLRSSNGDEDEAQAVRSGDGPTIQKGLSGRDPSLPGSPVTRDQHLAYACGSARSMATLRTIEVMVPTVRLRQSRRNEFSRPGFAGFAPCRGVSTWVRMSTPRARHAAE